ncbi:protein TIFY 8-like isoform X1 [Tasmannia lanceolata]|uniref:protein TIFY 8-like isoform X1 n=1 Tax=Tasmannia lanceolata TaxID=3420 RepID=UPI004063B326
MAILMMANDEEKPIFHDFFGTTYTDSASVLVKGFVAGETLASESSPSASIGASSGGHGLVSATSDLGSERQAGNNFEGGQFHGTKSDFSGTLTEISKRFLGRKRSNSDSAFMGSNRDRILPMGPDSLESLRHVKMFQNEMGGERQRRSHDNELLFTMQPPRPTCTSPLILQPPINSRPDLAVSNWERSMPMNVGPMMHHPSRLGRVATYVDKHSSNKNRETSASTSLISQPAADEGSRTGIKGSSILNVINSYNGVNERNPTGVLPNSNKLKAVPQNTDTDSANCPSRCSLTSCSRQMTIFYGGQAHVFDDVHPNKADAIMALAGSNGGSWSTTFLPKSSARPPLNETYAPSGENETGVGNIALSQDTNGRLSLLGTSNQGFSERGRIPIPGDPLNLSSSGHQGTRLVRDARTAAQAAEPGNEGKKEV